MLENINNINKILLTVLFIIILKNTPITENMAAKAIAKSVQKAAQKAAKTAAKKAAQLAAKAAKKGKKLTKVAKKTGSKTAKVAKKAGSKTAKVAKKAGKKLGSVVKKTGKKIGKAAKKAGPKKLAALALLGSAGGLLALAAIEHKDNKEYTAAVEEYQNELKAYFDLLENFENCVIEKDEEKFDLCQQQFDTEPPQSADLLDHDKMNDFYNIMDQYLNCINNVFIDSNGYNSEPSAEIESEESEELTCTDFYELLINNKPNPPEKPKGLTDDVPILGDVVDATASGIDVVEGAAKSAGKMAKIMALLAKYIADHLYIAIGAAVVLLLLFLINKLVFILILISFIASIFATPIDIINDIDIDIDSVSDFINIIKNIRE